LRFWILTLVAAACGCDVSEPQAARLPALVEGSAVIRGKVTFIGDAPVMRTIPNRPCHEGAGPITEEFVLVNDNGTLRNVFVYLEGAPASDGSAREAALLDQVDCRYVPHALGVQIGQPIRVRSSDATLHNVHWTASVNPARNFGMTGAGQEKTVSFARPEMIAVRCDVHPWMIAYVGVFENPWFAVTGDSGSFEIARVPAGSYTLVAWHERYGRLQQNVTVSDDRVMEAEFEFKQE
jgi:hypothetical protein